MQEMRIQNGKYFLEGEFYPPKGKDGDKFPLVIMCHALGASKNNFRLTAENFAREGVGAFTFNFRGGGREDKSTFGTEKMTLFTEKEDLFCVFKHFQHLPFVKNISLFGASQGGMVAAMFAEEHRKEISSLVLLYPGFNIEDALLERFPKDEEVSNTFEIFSLTLGKNYVLSMRNFHTFQKIGSFSRPVLIFHGREDNIVPLSYSRRAVKIYKDARLLELKGEGHGFSKEGNAFAAERSAEFINRILS